MSTHTYDALVIDAVKQTAPAVVSIVISKDLSKAKQSGLQSLLNPFRANGKAHEGDAKHDVSDDATHGNAEMTKVGGGSGFVVHPDGLILTNKHVVSEPEAEYTVVTDDLTEYPATVLSRDPINDIAILQIKAKGLQTVPLGNSTHIELGQTVIAIGNALGMFSNSVSKGIVSGLARSIQASLGNGDHIERLKGVIQTDVAINQGNSGGPLINLNGEAIAINTAVIFGAQNIGFSIPINLAKADLQDILKHGRIIKPYIGLMYKMLTKEDKAKYGFPVAGGALVMRDHVSPAGPVIPGSPADKAGIQENDIITRVDDTHLTEDHDLTDLLQEHAVGEKVTLELLRDGKPHHVSLTLEERT